MFLWRAKVKFKKHDDFVKKSNIKRSAILLLWDIDMKKKVLCACDFTCIDLFDFWIKMCERRNFSEHIKREKHEDYDPYNHQLIVRRWC